jgi:hypothetical protein
MLEILTDAVFVFVLSAMEELLKLTDFCTPFHVCCRP